MPIFEGFQYGLILTLIVGPSFFYLIRVSIRQGFRKAAAFTFGILISDLVFIAGIFFGMSRLFQQAAFQVSFSFIAGSIVLGMGVRYVLKGRDKSPILENGNLPEEKNKSIFSYLLKGIVINGFNPFTVMLWITVLGTVAVDKEYEGQNFLLFMTGLICTVVSADLTKAYMAHRISKLLKPRVLHIIDLVLGIIFILLSFRLFYFVYEHYSEV